MSSWLFLCTGESLCYKLEAWSRKNVGWVDSKMPTSCIMGRVGSSNFGAWPIRTQSEYFGLCCFDFNCFNCWSISLKSTQHVDVYNTRKRLVTERQTLLQVSVMTLLTSEKGIIHAHMRWHIHMPGKSFLSQSVWSPESASSYLHSLNIKYTTESFYHPAQWFYL